LPNGGEPAELSVEVFPSGIKPDIAVAIDPKTEQEAVLQLDAATRLTDTLQQRELKKGMSEADLVKSYRGESVEAPPSKEAAPEDAGVAEVRDVVLQRAVDVLKGMRVLYSWQ